MKLLLYPGKEMCLQLRKAGYEVIVYSGKEVCLQLRKAGYEVIVISRKGGVFTAEKGRI